MSATTRPTLHAIVQAAVDATGASRGWLLHINGTNFTVAAAYPHDEGVDLVGTERVIQGTAGFVASSGQPAAMQVRAGDDDNIGAGGAAGLPSALLAAPCGVEEVVGVLELVDPDGGTFTFDDVETAALLADVAGVALDEDEPALAPPTPAALAESLSRLERADSVRYAAIARAVQALL